MLVPYFRNQLISKTAEPTVLVQASKSTPTQETHANTTDDALLHLPGYRIISLTGILCCTQDNLTIGGKYRTSQVEPPTIHKFLQDFPK